MRYLYNLYQDFFLSIFRLLFAIRVVLLEYFVYKFESVFLIFSFSFQRCHDFSNKKFLLQLNLYNYQSVFLFASHYKLLLNYEYDFQFLLIFHQFLLLYISECLYILYLDFFLSIFLSLFYIIFLF